MPLIDRGGGSGVLWGCFYSSGTVKTVRDAAEYRIRQEDNPSKAAKGLTKVRTTLQRFISKHISFLRIGKNFSCQMCKAGRHMPTDVEL